MQPDVVFLVFNNAILVPWLLLLVAPQWRGTQKIVHAVWIPFLLAAVYIWAFASAELPEDGSFFTLPGVMRLFDSPHATVAGWVHYLTFDLFVGAWEVRDAQRRGISHAWVVPCLVCTLMLGPVGLGLYLVLRWSMKRATSLAEY